MAMTTRIAGVGRKPTHVNVPISRLHLDEQNPRLPRGAQGGSQDELLSVLYREFNLDELARSMAQNGYFDEEPLVGFPEALPSELANAGRETLENSAFLEQPGTEYTVVEGNRRLAAAKILLSPALQARLRIRNWGPISEEVADDLTILPVIVYPRRSEIEAYQGVRHIVGIQKWESYAKARYIAKLIGAGLSTRQVEEQVGDTRGAITKSYECYRILEQARDEFAYNARQAERDFSLLLLAAGQGTIRRFLGLQGSRGLAASSEPVPNAQLPNLRRLLTWIFGDGKTRPVIYESRDITNYLSPIVASEEAVQYLQDTCDLVAAYDRTGGEEVMLIKYLKAANSKLDAAMTVAHRHRTFEVLAELVRCEETVACLLKTVRERNA